MLDGAGHPFDLKAVQAGQQTPVYFGSAKNANCFIYIVNT